MKDVTLWKCDICGTEYRDKKKCEKCFLFGLNK